MIDKLLVVGDAHATPIASNDRFDWLGRLIMDHRPDVVYCTGDFGDMPSLSSYDKGRKSAELKRYKHDVKAVHDALARINKPREEHNEQQKKNKKSAYKPRMIMQGGNHDEARIEKAIQSSPELEGTMSIKDLNYEHYGWEYVPYRNSIVVEGIYCSHSFPSGVMGQPVSGLNVASSLLAKNSVSTIVGHCHLFDYAVRSKPNGDKLAALSPGWFGDHVEEYAKHTVHMWWSGVCLLHNVNDGVFDLETITMERIKKVYG